MKRSAPPVLLLDRKTIAELLTFKECVDAVEQAFAAHAKGSVLTPGLLHIEGDGGEFHVKAGGIRVSQTYFAVKVNGGFFGNATQHGLPNILGLIVLCHGGNGAPLAVMESGLITKLRTAAATSVAAKYLARPASETVTICGVGVQAQAQLHALKQVLPLKRAYLWSRTPRHDVAVQLSERLGVDVQSTLGLRAATHASDVIVTCTPAKSWFLGREHVKPGTFIAAIGADSPEKQEIEPALMAEAAVVCDLTEQCANVGELHHAIATCHMQLAGVRGELGAVVAGLVPGRQSEEEITVFDSTGTALQDAAAAAVYEKAMLRGQSTSFTFWG